MKLKKLLLAALLGSSVLALAACSTPGNKDSDDEAALSDANNNRGGAQTAGLGDEDGFGQDGRKGTLSQRTYYFDYDKSDVHEDDKPAILANASYLAAHANKKVIVEGHTDPRGSREYNVALGEHRSKAVADILKSNGVNPSQVREVSYGAERLASAGRSEEDFQKDRRAKIDYQN